MNKQQFEANAALEILNDVYVFNNSLKTQQNALRKLKEGELEDNRLEYSFLARMYNDSTDKDDFMHMVVTEINKCSNALKATA